MLLRELLLEASYNEFIDKLKRTYPDLKDHIQREVNWAKTTLKRDDRVMWFLKILKLDLENNFQSARGNLGQDALYLDYNDVKHTLEHYFLNLGFSELDRVKRYQFVDLKQRSCDQVLDDLHNIEQYELYVNDLVTASHDQGHDDVNKIVDSIKRFLQLNKSRDQTYNAENNTFYGQDLKSLPNDVARMLKKLKDQHSTDYRSKDAAAFKSGEAKIVYQGPGVTVIECTTMAGSLAAITYSNGRDDTKWCTGQRNPMNNLFDHYHREGTRSFVLHFPNESNNLDKIGIFGIVPGLDQSSIQSGVGGNFQDKGNVFLDDDRWEYLVEKYHLDQVPALKGVRGIGITREMYLAAVRNNSWALQHVPKKFLDQKMYLAAVRKDGTALQFVPENLRDREICFSAVKQHGMTLVKVPKNLRDHEMCLAAVSHTGYALQYVPEHLRDRNICLAAVREDGMALQYVPEHLRDRNICLAAVSHDSYALKHVPEQLRDKIRQELGLQDAITRIV